MSERLAQGDEHPVCAMSQGTSGDLHWMDYAIPRTRMDARRYTRQVVDRAHEILQSLKHRDWVPLKMDQRVMTLSRRRPDEARLEWATAMLAGMEHRRPRTRPEVYAEQARYLHENPTVRLVLQTLGVGHLGITAIPNEVFAISGLKLKALSPFEATFNIELANGAAGYVPPPAQHALGGYTAWPARTAGLEVQAEPIIVETLVRSLEHVAGRRRKSLATPAGRYTKAILKQKPLVFFRFDEFEGVRAVDHSGRERHGTYSGGVAYYLPGPDSHSFSGSRRNRAIHLAGGTMSADIPLSRNDHTVTFWFWNGMPHTVRAVTGTLYSLGTREALVITGNARPGAEGRLVFRSGDRFLAGKTSLGLRQWHHVLVSRTKDSVTVHLDGAREPEISGTIGAAASATRWTFGGHPDGSFSLEGRIDELAVFDHAWSGSQARQLHALSAVQTHHQAK